RKRNLFPKLQNQSFPRALIHIAKKHSPSLRRERLDHCFADPIRATRDDSGLVAEISVISHASSVLQLSRLSSFTFFGRILVRWPIPRYPAVVKPMLTRLQPRRALAFTLIE